MTNSNHKTVENGFDFMVGKTSGFVSETNYVFGRCRKIWCQTSSFLPSDGTSADPCSWFPLISRYSAPAVIFAKRCELLPLTVEVKDIMLEHILPDLGSQPVAVFALQT